MSFRFSQNLLFICIATAFLGAFPCDAQLVRSSNGEFEAVQDSDSKKVVINRVEGGEKAPWYTIDGGVRGSVFLSDDGQHLAACLHGLEADMHPDDVVVRFYRTGTLFLSLRLKDVMRRTRNMIRQNSKRIWGSCFGFSSNDVFHIDTVEKRRLNVNLHNETFRMSRGVWPPAKPAPVVADFVSSKMGIPRDCDSDSFLFCDRLIDFRSGWRQVRGKWEYITDKDGDRLLFQKSDRVKEGNALIYFDNLNVADADILTYLKVEPSFPELAIDEDEARIRRLRRIAGAGLVFRLRDENNYYMFRLAGLEGAVLGKMVDGEWFDLANPRAADFMTQGKVFDADQWLGLRVRVRGDVIQCWIIERSEEGDWKKPRSQAVASVLDDTLLMGKVGLVTFEMKAKFSFISIKDL